MIFEAPEIDFMLSPCIECVSSQYSPAAYWYKLVIHRYRNFLANNVF